MASTGVSKSWCFTLNHYTDAECETIKLWTDEVKKLVVGKEVGECGTPHLQGFVTFARAYRLRAVRKLLERAHWEIARAADAALYCAKDGEMLVNYRAKAPPKEEGTLRKYMKMSIERAQEESPELNLIYLRKRLDLQRYLLKPFDGIKTVIWLWGAPGTGKTTLARAITGDGPRLSPSGEQFPLNGYDGEPAIIIDELDGSDYWLSLNGLGTFLQLTDSHPTRLNTKGGSCPFATHTIVVCSNTSPDELWLDTPALRRKRPGLEREGRLTTVICLDDHDWRDVAILLGVDV